MLLLKIEILNKQKDEEDLESSSEHNLSEEKCSSEYSSKVSINNYDKNTTERRQKGDKIHEDLVENYSKLNRMRKSNSNKLKLGSGNEKDKKLVKLDEFLKASSKQRDSLRESSRRDKSRLNGGNDMSLPKETETKEGYGVSSSAGQDLEDDADGLKMPRFMIHPKSSLMFKVKMVRMATKAYIAIIVPFRIPFEEKPHVVWMV